MQSTNEQTGSSRQPAVPPICTFKSQRVSACRHPLSLQDVRMSPDNLRAFILWDSFNGQPGPLDRELRRQ